MYDVSPYDPFLIGGGGAEVILGGLGRDCRGRRPDILDAFHESGVR
jgi:hypothetical protein